LLLLQGLLTSTREMAAQYGSLAGALGLVCLGGWACSLVAMRRLGVVGNGVGSRATYAVQLALVFVAALFSVQETA
jgi:hypothetical protein